MNSRPAIILFLASAIAWGLLFVLGVSSGVLTLSGLGLAALATSILVLMPSSQGWLFSAVLVLVSVQWSVTVIEVGLRTLLADSLYFRAHERLIGEWPNDPNILRYAPNAAIAQPAVGDLGAMSGRTDWHVKKTIEFVTDAQGFRNAARQNSAQAIVVLGDSFAAGTGITQADSWAVRLQQLTGREVINLAIPSSPWMSLANFWYENDRVGGFQQADVVLTLFSGNDLDEVYGRRRAFDGQYRASALRRWLTRLENFQRKCALDKVWLLLTVEEKYGDQVVAVDREGGVPVLFFKPYVERALRSATDVETHDNFADLTEILTALAEKVRASGGRLSIVNVPSKAEIHAELLGRAYQPQGFAQAMAPVVRALGAHWIDLSAPMRREAVKRQAAGQEGLWWPDDTHWNAQGHAVVAELIAEHLGALDSKGE